MRYRLLTTASSIFSLFLLGCAGTGKGVPGVHDREDIVTVKYLLQNRKSLDGHPVQVSGFFDAHHDGSSLRMNSEHSKESVLVPYWGFNPVVVRGRKVVTIDQWSRWQNTPVIISGTFRVASFSHMGLVTPNVAMIDPTTIVVVDHDYIQSNSADSKDEQGSASNR